MTVRFNLYGLAIVLGIAAAVIYMRQESKRLKLPQDLAVDMALWSVPPAVVAARLYYVAFAWELFKNDPLSIFKVWEGGLAIYGGVIGGALGVLLLSRRRRLPFLQLADLVAPGLILAQAIGRWGNYFNGEAYGYAVTNKALQFFPLAVLTNGTWHMATFFYESLWNFLGFLLLLKLRRRFYQNGHGLVFYAYLMVYGVGRMVIEGLRTDSLMLGAARVSQLLSVALVAFAGFMIIKRLGRGGWNIVPLFLGLILLFLAAAGFAWALVPAYVLIAVFAALVLLPPKLPVNAKGSR